MKQLTILLISIFLFSVSAHADFLEKKSVKLGEPVADFTLKDLKGTAHSLSSYKGKPVMIHFWSAQCPFVIRYNERLNQITEEYGAKGVVVLAINSNSTENVQQMEQVAEERANQFPILVDPGNKVADQFGAITTPHVFIINPEGVLVYEGAVDDQGYAEHNKIKEAYTRDALDAVLEGNVVPNPQTKSVGCTVKRVF